MFAHPLVRFALLASCLLAAAPATAANPFPQAGAAYVIKSGETTFWSHQAEKRLPPASLTKMMTALVVLERASLDDVVTVSATAAAERGSRIRLQPGERLLVRDLLAALLICSANDAAHALADHVAGSERAFAALMNVRATRLGLRNTHFVNASGLDHPRHYSTASDLARLAEAALSEPVFRSLVVQPAFEIRAIGKERTFRFRNSNKLLGRYDGLAGVKTGYTSKAGPCLVIAAERDEERVIVVLLNSPRRWEEAPHLLDRAFARRAEMAATRQVAHLDAPEPLPSELPRQSEEL